MSLVLFEKIAPYTGIIKLNDPNNLNAMSNEMAAEFSSVVSKIKSTEKKLRAVILTGEGKAFSAGGHLEMLEKKIKLGKEQNKLEMIKFYKEFLSITNLTIPVIASINGSAVGAGLCLAIAADIRIAASSAKLGFTFTKLGLHPGLGVTHYLPKIVGYAKASDLLITAKIIDAKTALEYGLISKVVSDDQLINEAVELANQISVNGPESTSQLVTTLRYGYSSLDQALEREAFCQSDNYASAEFSEGIKAIKEKRKAVF